MNKTSPKVVAVIPARGGSKTIPGKNIKLFHGHPLIAYSIAAGLKAKTVSRTIVSTDDAKIAYIARRYGAEVPFLRPARLAGDNTADFPVFEHILKWLEKEEGYCPDILVQLRPTSPLRPLDCVDRAVNLLLNTRKADSVRGITIPVQNPFKMWRVNEGFMVPILRSNIREAYNAPRQKLPEIFWQTGHIDAIRRDTITKKRSLTGERITPLFIEHAYSIDLDTLEDWEFAEWIISQKNLSVVRPSCPPLFFGEIRILVLDFDGVFTDNRVYITQDGKESVRCSRSDGMGLASLRESGIKAVVLSSEINPVVSARCQKLNIPCYQGLKNKKDFLLKLLAKNGLNGREVIYLGNDINDMGCMGISGCAVAVADAHSDVLRAADFILQKPGGKGAIRELCDLIIASKKGSINA